MEKLLANVQSSWEWYIKRGQELLRVANWLKSRKGLPLHYIMFKEIRDDLINDVQREKVSLLIVFCFSRICNIDT